MQTTLRTLLDLRARTEEDRFPVRALFHRAGTRELAYAAIDVGGWLDRREVLVDIERFGTPEDGEWPVTLGRSDLDDAPVLEDGDSGALDALPPLVVGPFGYTFSPLMMAASVEASAAAAPPGEPDGEGRPPETHAHGRLTGIERSNDWLGREAFGPDGEMGRIEDVVVEDRRLTAVVLADETRIPLDRLRRLAEQGHAVFD